MFVKVVFLIFIFLSPIATAETVEVNKRDKKNVIDSKDNAAEIPAGSFRELDSTKNGGVEKDSNSLIHNLEISHEAPLSSGFTRQSVITRFPTSQAMTSGQQVGNLGFSANFPGAYLENEAANGNNLNDNNPGFSYKNLFEDVRTGLGEDVYGKLTWIYYDIKEFDALIYSNLMVYDSKISNLAGEFWKFIGVDAQVSAMIIFGDGQMFSGDAAGSHHAINQGRGGESHNKVVLDLSAQNPVNIDVVENGYFKFILKYLTIRNVVYVLLGILGAGLIMRVFKFFVKQDLS